MRARACKETPFNNEKLNCSSTPSPRTGPRGAGAELAARTQTAWSDDDEEVSPPPCLSTSSSLLCVSRPPHPLTRLLRRQSQHLRRAVQVPLLSLNLRLLLHCVSSATHLR